MRLPGLAQPLHLRALRCLLLAFVPVFLCCLLVVNGASLLEQAPFPLTALRVRYRPRQRHSGQTMVQLTTLSSPLAVDGLTRSPRCHG